MYKEREVIDEEIKKEVEMLRNTHDTLSLIPTEEFNVPNIMIPYINGQAAVCQTTLNNQLTEEQRYFTLRKLIAYQTIMLGFINFPEPKVEEGENIINMSAKAVAEREAQSGTEQS